MRRELGRAYLQLEILAVLDFFFEHVRYLAERVGAARLSTVYNLVLKEFLLEFQGQQPLW
jgi:hypothetical protein